MATIYVIVPMEVELGDEAAAINNATLEAITGQLAQRGYKTELVPQHSDEFYEPKNIEKQLLERGYELASVGMGTSDYVKDANYTEEAQWVRETFGEKAVEWVQELPE